MFKISFSVTALNFILILVGDRRYFCMFFLRRRFISTKQIYQKNHTYNTNTSFFMKEVVNMNVIGQIFSNCGKKGIKRVDNVYWLIYSLTIMFKFTRKICLFAMSKLRTHQLLSNFFLIIFISPKLSQEVIDFCFIICLFTILPKVLKLVFLISYSGLEVGFFPINVFLIFYD